MKKVGIIFFIFYLQQTNADTITITNLHNIGSQYFTSDSKPFLTSNNTFIYLALESLTLNSYVITTVNVETGNVKKAILSKNYNNFKGLSESKTDSLIYALAKKVGDNHNNIVTINNVSGAVNLMYDLGEHYVISAEPLLKNNTFMYIGVESLMAPYQMYFYSVDIKKGIKTKVALPSNYENISGLYSSDNDSIIYALAHKIGDSHNNIITINSITGEIQKKHDLGVNYVWIDAKPFMLQDSIYIYLGYENLSAPVNFLFTVNVKTGAIKKQFKLLNNQYISGFGIDLKGSNIVAMQFKTPSFDTDIISIKLPQDSTITGINEQTTNAKISIYPNPSTASFNVQLQQPLQNASLQITNSVGVVVYSQSYSGLQNTTINTTGFASGLYNVSISNGNTSFSKKLLVY